jgi:hypothetical protein
VTPSETRSWARVRVDRKVDSDAGPNREFQAEKGRQQRSESCEGCKVAVAEDAECFRFRPEGDCIEGGGSAAWRPVFGFAEKTEHTVAKLSEAMVGVSQWWCWQQRPV